MRVSFAVLFRDSQVALFLFLRLTVCGRIAETTFMLRMPNGYRATSEYSRRYPRRTFCRDPAIRRRYAALPVRCPASGRGETEAAAQCRIRRSLVLQRADQSLLF